MTKDEAIEKLKTALRERGWYPVNHTVELDVCENAKAGVWSFVLSGIDGVEIDPNERVDSWDVEENAPVYAGSLPQFDKYDLNDFVPRGRIKIAG